MGASKGVNVGVGVGGYTFSPSDPPAAARNWDEVYAIRRAVSRWLRVRAENVDDSIGLMPGMLDKAAQRQVLTQVAADADHSDLLIRLLRGEEPLPFDDWKSRA